MRQNPNFVSSKFLENYKFPEHSNNIFEDSSPKVNFRQVIRIFDFSSLASDSRKLQSGALKQGFISFSTTIEEWQLYICKKRKVWAPYNNLLIYVDKRSHDSLFYSGFMQEDSTTYQSVWQTSIPETLYPEQE